MNKDLCQMIAMLITDGGISPHQETSWEIHFRNKSDQLNTLFREVTYSLFKVYPTAKVRSDGTTIQRLRSKNIGEKLLNITNSYRTLACESSPICGRYRNARIPCLKCSPKEYSGVAYPTIKFPTEIEKNTQLAKIFLKIAYSCDGGVSLYEAHRDKQSWLIRKVFIDSKHPLVRNYYQKLLEKLGFRTKIYGSQIRIQKREMFKKFSKEIGFVKGVKIGKDSKYWVDKTKNELLSLLLRSYKGTS
jgi:hypothetical protein